MSFGRLGLAMVLTGVALLTISSAGAAVNTGHSGWNWGSPLPQGEAIHAIDFQGTRGYAAGDFGTLTRSDDAGLTWTGLAIGTTEDLTHVAIIGLDSVVVAGKCTVRRSDDAGRSFRRLPWTASDDRCGSPVVALAFPTSQRGFLALEDGTVFETQDGGATWSRRTQLPTGRGAPAAPTATGVTFTSAQTGFRAPSAGLIYRTTDAAATWTLVKQVPVPLRDIRFVTETTGYAVGDGVEVARTTYGGATWTDRIAGAGAKLTSIRCADTLTCIATTELGDRVLRTN